MTLSKNAALANDNKSTEMDKTVFLWNYSTNNNRDKTADTFSISSHSFMNKENVHGCPGATNVTVRHFDSVDTELDRNMSSKSNFSVSSQASSGKHDKSYFRPRQPHRGLLHWHTVVPSLNIPGYPQRSRRPSIYQVSPKESNIINFAQKHPAFYDPERALGHLKIFQRDYDKSAPSRIRSSVDISRGVSKYTASQEDFGQRGSVRFPSVSEKRTSTTPLVFKPSTVAEKQPPLPLPPTPPPTDLKIKITSAMDLVPDEPGLFDYMNPILVPVKGSSGRRGVSGQAEMHTEWLETRRRLGRTEETRYVNYLGAVSTDRVHFAEDTRKAFFTARLPTARRSPAVIKWPDPRDPVLFRSSKDDAAGTRHKRSCRDSWWSEADGNIRVDNLGIGTARLYPWSRCDASKVKWTTCYFLDRALGPAPAHRRLVSPGRIFRESQPKEPDALETEKKRGRASKQSVKSSVASLKGLLPSKGGKHSVASLKGMLPTTTAMPPTSTAVPTPTAKVKEES